MTTIAKGHCTRNFSKGDGGASGGFKRGNGLCGGAVAEMPHSDAQLPKTRERGLSPLDWLPRAGTVREQFAVFCSRLIVAVNRPGSHFLDFCGQVRPMSASLFDRNGIRKYLTARERIAFVRAARDSGGEVATFCLTLAFTGARISELLALTRERIDVANGSIVLETLKRRRPGVFRVVPVSPKLLSMLRTTHGLEATGSDPNARIWNWGRTTAWKRVKAVMKDARVPNRLSMPKSVRHAFAVGAIQSSVALNVVQRWMGHARIETTAIYTDAVGREERALARRAWHQLEQVL